jgi:hypothetical protein
MNYVVIVRRLQRRCDLSNDAQRHRLIEWVFREALRESLPFEQFHRIEDQAV